MYLEPWMLYVLALTFGFCAWWNRRCGFRAGAFQTLDLLEQDKIISINDEGDIRPYRNPCQ